MGEPFLAELKVVSFTWAPKGWALCNGQLLPINQNQALFSLLGTTYGGDGQVNFALPDLRGRVPMHFDDNSHSLGERAGEQAHTVTISELPTHTHIGAGTHSTATSNIPTGNLPANVPTANAYADPASLVALVPQTIANVGGSQAHNNMSPYLTLNVIIALQGIFPSRN